MTTPLFDLGKLRYHYRGAFDGNTPYESNDVVTYGGNLYCYIFGIASSGTLPTVTTKWAMMLQGFKYAGKFDLATAYHVGEVVTQGSGLFVALVDTQGNYPADGTKWAVLATGIQYRGTYDGAAVYTKDDVVAYGGMSYISKGDVTGVAPTDVTKWDLLVSGVVQRGAYLPATAYHKGDIVNYGAGSYIAKQDVTGIAPNDASKWDVFVSGVQVKGAYAAGTQYNRGDIVSYGASTYIALDDALGVVPTNVAKWAVLVAGLVSQGAYNAATQYRKGHVVSYGASAYVAKGDTLGNKPTDAANWDLLASGVRFRGAWASGAAYLANDLVTDGASSFIALAEVTSAARPSTDPTNWQTAMAGSDQCVAKGGDTMTGPLGLGGELNGGGNDYRNINPKVQVVTGTATVDITAAPIVVLDTPAAASQITFSGLPAAGHVAYWELEIVAPGANAITFGNAITWDTGSQPPINTGTKTTILAFRARNKAGTTKIIGAASFGDVA